MGNIAFFVPFPLPTGEPNFGPDRCLTITGRGVHGTMQNIKLHHEVIMESCLVLPSSHPLHFKLDELQDVESFAKAMLNPNDRVGWIVRNRLPDLGSWNGTSPLPPALGAQLISVLNGLVQQPGTFGKSVFVDPPPGSLASVLAESPNPTHEQQVLLVKTMIEDAYPSALSRHRRPRSAFGMTSTVWIGVNYAVSTLGTNLPFVVTLVCRPNTCSKQLAAAITRGEVTDIQIGGDIIGATMALPPTVRLVNSCVVTRDERVISLGFGGDSGFTAPRTPEEYNELVQRLGSQDPEWQAPNTLFEPPGLIEYGFIDRPDKAA